MKRRFVCCAMLAAACIRTACARELRTAGFSLTLDETGKVTAVSAGGNRLKVRPAPFVSVCPAGAAQFEALTPAGGDMETGLVLRSKTARLTVRLRGRSGKGERGVLHFTCTVKGDPGPARGLLLRFSLPFDAVGWKWANDMQNTETIAPGKVYENVRPLRAWPDLPEWRDKPDLRMGYSNRNFCTVLSGPVGVCLAVPLDRPCIFRTAYDVAARRLQIVYDFALSPDTAQPNEAAFAFDLYSCDPAWGFRSALEHYYRLYPQFFRVYVPDPGQWMAFTRLSGIDNVNEFLFRLQEGAPEPGYDDKIDVLSAVYFTHAGMFARIPGYAPEKDPLPPFGRQLEAMDAAFKRRTGSPDMFRRVGLFTPDGRLDIRKTRVYGHIISQFNLDPDLPYGAWALKRALQRTERVKAKNGARLDGFYYDGLSSGINYRPEHFKTAAAPCLWDPVHKKPFLNNFFSSCEFARAAAELLRPRGQITMMNGALNATFYVAPWLDLFGAETGLRIPREQFNFIRAVTYHKPFLTLLKGNYEQKIGRAQIELFMKRCLAYGVFPGFFDWPPSGLGPGSRYWDHPVYYERDRDLFRKYLPLCRALAKAGWEPVTRARSSVPDVYVERFGPSRDGVLWLTLLNEKPQPQRIRLSVDARKLGVDPARVQVLEILTNRPLPARPSKNGGLELELNVPGDGVLCLQAAPPDAAARWRIDQAIETLDRGVKMREVDKDKPPVAVHWRPKGMSAYDRGTSGGSRHLIFKASPRATRSCGQWVMLFQNDAAPLTLRVRAAATDLSGKKNSAVVRCRLAWVTRSFTHYETQSFEFPGGTYAWRDFAFPLRSSHALRSVYVQPEVRPAASGELRLARISIVDPGGREYAVDPEFRQWYESVPAPLRPRIAAACRELRNTLVSCRKEISTPPRLRARLLAAFSAMGGLRDLVHEKRADNSCRRVLRDLETIERHLAAVVPFAFGITPPVISGPATACPGDVVPLRFTAPKVPGAPTRTALVCDGVRISPRPDGADLHVPGDAEVGTVLRVTGRLEFGPPAKAAVLTTERRIIVTAPVDLAVATRSVDTESGTCTLRVRVRNNMRSPLSGNIEISAPPGWRATPLGPLAVDPGNETVTALRLLPSNRARPGRTRVGVTLRTRGRTTRSSTRFVYIPKAANRLRNPGFEQGLKAWNAPSGKSGTTEAGVAGGKACLFLENRSAGDSTVSQTVVLNQTAPCPLWIQAASRAAGVSGPVGRGYSLYVDLYYTDGAPSYGHTWDFPTGTTRWQTGTVIIEPEKAIRNVNVYLLLRGKRGKVFFDDIALMEDPARKGNLARTARVTVDSSYSGYTARPINDGRVVVEGLHWSRQAWASADNGEPHYVVFRFDAPRSLGRGTVYWAVDAGAVETSQEVLFQVDAGTEWKTVARISPAQAERRTEFRFSPVRGTRFRLLQPAGRGPRQRPGLLWLREVELFPPATLP
ncbi:MAG: hypothetical protein GXP31_01420 [Kiritimatiellaeota bacterium]|nr:hypothetical protein [Kiritimatiellota bacterium]